MGYTCCSRPRTGLPFVLLSYRYFDSLLYTLARFFASAKRNGYVQPKHSIARNYCSYHEVREPSVRCVDLPVRSSSTDILLYVGFWNVAD